MFKKLPNIIDITPTGSRVICNPPPLDTDKDFVVLIHGPVSEFIDDLTGNHGWESDTKYPGSDFTSLRRGKVNYIVTESEDFYKKFVLATKIAKSLNLTDKKDRVTLFQGVLYKNVPRID